MPDTVKTESAPRGTKFRIETGPEREKPLTGISAEESLMGRTMGGGPTDLSHSIQNGKVPRGGK